MSHGRLSDWLFYAEMNVQALESSIAMVSSGLGFQGSTIDRLENELGEFRSVLDIVNQIGPQLQQRRTEDARFIETLVARDNRRFNVVCEQIQRKAERLHLSRLRSMEVIGDLDDLLDWFRETESHLREAEPPSSDPEIIRVQLKEYKILGDEIASQKGCARDVLSAAKKVLRDLCPNVDAGFIRERLDDLKDATRQVLQLSLDHLSILEQALPLAEHFYDAHAELSAWFDEMEAEMMNLDPPAFRDDQNMRQQEENKLLLIAVSERKTLVDKLNKTGSALAKLCIEEEGVKVNEILESDNERYSALRASLRQRQQALEVALQETNKFSVKLNGMLAALSLTFEQIKSAEPVSAFPEKLQEQIKENEAVVEDLEKRESSFEAVLLVANDVISKADSSSDSIDDIKAKVEDLTNLW